MRKDIEIHIKTGDVVLAPQNQFQTRPFRWVENPNGLSRYAYAEVLIPAVISENFIRENGFYISIPYTPVFKEFMVCVKRVYEDGSFVYLHNMVDGSIWHVVKSGLYGTDKTNVYVSKLITVSDDFSYFVQLHKEFAYLYSAVQSDFRIVDANRQNSNCLLACVPTNNYRYPLTGVGLVRWINSHNINNTVLAEVIRREFMADGVIPQDAHYDYDTQQMNLNLDVSKID